MKGAVILLLVCAALGCDTLKSAGNAGKDLLIDCTRKETAAVVGEMAPLVETVLIQSADSSGKVSWDPLKDLGKRFTADVGGCIVADVVSRVLRPAPADPSAPQLAPLAVDLEQLRADFDAFKAQRFGGVTFKTANGARL